MKNSDIAVFSNRCTIQTGVFSVPMYNSFTDPITQKIIRLVSYAEEGVEQFINIEAFPSVGLPTTTDLTLYLALQKLLDENYRYLRSSEERIEFSRYELLQKIGLKNATANYDRIKLWGQRMKETAVRFFKDETRSKTFGTYNVFQEFVTKGTELDDDTIADQNWILLSKWELDNRIYKPLIPIDFTTYLKIRDKKAQLLIPHIQAWLYASQRTTVFRKNYRELCSLIGLKPQKHISAAERQFDKTFAILIKEEYLDTARIYESKGTGDFIVEMKHGEKFFRDKDAFKILDGGGGQKDVGTGDEKTDVPEKPNLIGLPKSTKTNDDRLDAEQRKVRDRLIEKEVDETDATAIVLERALNEVTTIIDYCEHLFETNPRKYRSQRGYLFKLLKDQNFAPPASFSELFEKTKQFKKPTEDFNAPEYIEERKSEWLDEEYAEFCYRQAIKTISLDFKDFAAAYGAGEKLWEQMKAVISRKFDKNIFEPWFKPVKVADFDETDCRLTLIASQVAYDWIKSYYAEALSDALMKVDAPDCDVELLPNDSVMRAKTDVKSFYRLKLINEFQNRNDISFETFVAENQIQLDQKFNELNGQSR